MTSSDDEGCGGCHVWGYNPEWVGDVCETCDRSESEILNDHGVVNLDRQTAIDCRIKNQGPDYDVRNLPID